jgi:excisionase family DNA binding protein
MTSPTEAYLLAGEIAARLRVSKMTVYRLIHSGAFPGTIQIGRTFRVPPAAVDAYEKASTLR